MNRRQLATLIARQWWSARILNVVLIAILTMGVVLYLLYGSWQGAVHERMSTESVPLDVTVPLIIMGPDYLSQSVDSSLNALAGLEGHPLVERGARKLSPFLQTDMLTPFGHVRVTGLSLGVPELREALPVVSGHWPEKVDELLLPVALNTFGWKEGQVLKFGYFDPFRRQVRWGTLVLAGYYRPEGDVITTAVVSDVWLRDLSGLGPNGLLLWPNEGVSNTELATFVRDALPGTLNLRRPGVRGLVPERESDLSGGGPYRGYSMLPYAHTVGLTLYTPSLPEHIARNRLLDVSIPLSKLVVLVLSVVVVGVSLGVLGMLFDQQKNIGLFSAVGMTHDELRWLFGGMFLLDVVVSLVIGATSCAVVVGRLGQTLGLPMHMPWGGLVLWALGYTALALWVGRLVRVFSRESEVPELLRGQARPDFWAFIRL